MSDNTRNRIVRFALIVYGLGLIVLAIRFPYEDSRAWKDAVAIIIGCFLIAGGAVMEND